MKEVTATVKHAVGLHARPAAKFARLAKGFASEIRITNITRGGDEVDAKSLVKVIKIAAAQNHEVRVTATGDDEDDAIAAIRSYLEDVPPEEQ